MATSRSSGPTPRALVLPALLLLPLAGCDQTELAMGEFNDLYVVAEPATWQAVGDTVESALQPTVQTVADELIYDVVHVDPTEQEWPRLKRLRQILMIGSPEDPWIDEVVQIEGDGPVEAPTILRAYDVWARNQLVTLVVLEEERLGEQMTDRLGEIRTLYDSIFRDYTQRRMWISGADTTLAGQLAREHGFSLMLPDVYQWDARDSTFIFRNDQPSPDELIRQLHVTWRSPVPDHLDALLSTDSVIAWRQEVSEQSLEYPHQADTTLLATEPIEHRGHEGYRVQARWANPPEANWPAGGPFITEVIACIPQSRVYLIDAWLYAPGRDKYEYILQLETLLDSFRCDGRPSVAPEGAQVG